MEDFPEELFDEERAGSAWRALCPDLYDPTGRMRSTWRRLVTSLKKRGIENLDGGLLRVIAAFGENMATIVVPGARMQLEAEGRSVTIQVDRGSNDLRDRHLLLRAGRTLWSDAVLHESIKHIFDRTHERGDGKQPGFDALRRELDLQLRDARHEGDADAEALLGQIDSILRTVIRIGPQPANVAIEDDSRINRIVTDDGNIEALRRRYPQGLHFAVGDTHGEAATLGLLMDKIRFDPQKDHVYFVGDYNGGGHVRSLMGYLGRYYQEDLTAPGFHLIRGNHERDEGLSPVYPLEKQPDLLILRFPHLDFCVAHAGLVAPAVPLIRQQLQSRPDEQVLAFALDESCAAYRMPLNQMTWSCKGLYGHHGMWPDERTLDENRLFILHGHTPYVYMKRGDYGDTNLFWSAQHIWFSEDLHAINLDANVKGRYDPQNSYRGLACVCLEVIDELAAAGRVTVEAVRSAPNFAFGVPYAGYSCADIDSKEMISDSRPRMRRIRLDARDELVMEDG